MEEVVKKNLWVVKLLGGLVVLGFAASALVGLLGSAREGDELGVRASGDGEAALREGEGAPTKGSRAKGSRAKAKANTAAFLVARNLFCPTCAPIEVGPEPDDEKPGPTASGHAAAAAVKSTLPLALIATMESDDMEASMATIADTERGKVGSYNVAEAVRPGVTLIEIGRGRVVLQNGGRREFLLLGETVAGTSPAPTVTLESTATSAETSPREIEGAKEAISCEGDTCTVDRAFVDKVLASPTLLAKQARVVPSIKDGETLGYKVYGVRSGSLPKLLGIKNGDTLKSVNGKAITSLEDAMGVYDTVRKSSKVSIELDRRGEPVTKDLTIK